MVFDPASAAVAGGTSLVGLLLKQKADKEAARAAAENLKFQKEVFGEVKKGIPEQQQGRDIAKSGLDELRALGQEGVDFASGGRSDAMGNKVYYDPVRGWVTNLAPGQRDLVRQGADVRSTALDRSRTASQDYDEARTQLKYAPRPSEGALRNEITNLILQTLGQGDQATQMLANRQAVRQRGNMPIVVQAGGATPASENAQRLAQALLQARTQALTEVDQREKAIQGRYLPMMDRAERTAVSGLTLPEDPIVARLGNEQADIQKLIATMINQRGQQVGQGYGLVGDAQGRIAQAFNALNPAGQNVNTAAGAQTKTLAEAAPDLRGMASIMSSTQNLLDPLTRTTKSAATRASLQQPITPRQATISDFEIY